MSTIKITISEEVITSVVRPISLFLNDVKKGSTFSHIMLEDGLTSYDKDDENFIPAFKYSNSNGGIYKFRVFDLQKFTKDGEKFSNYFIPQPNKECLLQTEFKVLGCKAMLDDDKKKIYPYFAYNGYPAYQLARKTVSDTNKANRASGLTTDVEYLDRDVIDTLLASGIKTGFDDRYYRIVDIDKEIFYYLD